MANTNPVTDTAEAAERILDLGRAAGLVDVVPVGAVTKGLEGAELAELGLMHRSRAGVQVFSDDGHCVADARVMRRALEYVAPSAAWSPSTARTRTSPARRPAATRARSPAGSACPAGPRIAEESIIARDVMLAEHTGSRVHVAHVTTAEGLDVVRWAKARGIADDRRGDPAPPRARHRPAHRLRPGLQGQPAAAPERGREALVEGLLDGTIDAVATDHAPHARHDKEHAFVDAAFGMLGLETAFAVVHDLLVADGRLGWADLARVMSTGPARIAGLADHGHPVAAGAPGQPRARRPHRHGHRRPRRLAVPVPQHPVARRSPHRRRPHHDPARPRHGPWRGAHRMLTTREPAVLVLEDGRTFTGRAYGHRGSTVGEAVFSTGMTGYQETLTDPSYHRQVVVMTAPHVGNTGWNDEDDESGRIWVAGYVVRDPALRPSQLAVEPRRWRTSSTPRASSASATSTPAR